MARVHIVSPYRPRDGPRLGPLHIAQHLKNRGHEVRVISPKFMEEPEDYAARIRIYAAKEKPHVVGFSTYPYWPEHDFNALIMPMARGIKSIREVSPGTMTVLGGHGSIEYPKQYLENLGADAVVDGLHGQAMGALDELAGAVERGHNRLSVPGLIYLENGKVKHTGERVPQELPEIRYHEGTFGVPAEDFKLAGMPVLSVFNQLSCPWSRRNGCTYCGVAHVNQRLMERYRNQPEVYRRLIKQDYERTAREAENFSKAFPGEKINFTIADSVATPAALKGYLSALEARGVMRSIGEVRFLSDPRFLRGRNLDEVRRVLDDFHKRYGVTFETQVGVENPNPEELRWMNRPGYTQKDTDRIFRGLFAPHTDVSAFLLLTTPDTTRQTLSNTVRYAVDLAKRGHDISVQPYVVPHPGLLDRFAGRIVEHKITAGGKEWVFPGHIENPHLTRIDVEKEAGFVGGENPDMMDPKLANQLQHLEDSLNRAKRTLLVGGRKA